MPLLDVVKTATFAAGRAIGAAAVWTGAKVSAAYHTGNPDLWKHIAELPLLGVTALAPSRTTVVPLPDDGHRPVVLVSGLGGYPGNMSPLRAYLRLGGRTRVYTFGCESGLGLEALAARLRRFVAQVLSRNRLGARAQVDVVTHSMGGLVARLALEDRRTRARIANMVTMACPHSGSHLARYGAFENCLQLRPDSAVFARLSGQLPWRGPPYQPRLVCLWSTSDVLLLPASSARMEGAENVQMPGFTHYRYLFHPAAARQVLASLARRNEEETAPRPTSARKVVARRKAASATSR